MSATRSDRPYIAVIGRGEYEEEACAHAEAIGRELAARDAVVVCGGRGGVMEAVARGAHEAGGTTIGLLPGDRRDDANGYLSVAVATGLGEMRNMLVVTAADAVIAVSGEFGTLSELAYALRIGKPVVGLNTWELSKGGEATDAVAVVDSPGEAVDLALRLATS